MVWAFGVDDGVDSACGSPGATGWPWWSGQSSAQQAFSRQLIASQEAERKRIAAELHDSLGQRLVVIKNLALLSLTTMEDQDLRRRMDEISAESSHAMSEVREISYNLRPYQLDRLGLRKAILALVRNVSRATDARLTADVDDEIEGFLPKESEINFYRIVQECLNNVMKHSQATEVDLSIERRDDTLSLVIRDNGCGFSSRRFAFRSASRWLWPGRHSRAGGITRRESSDPNGSRPRHHDQHLYRIRRLEK